MFPSMPFRHIKPTLTEPYRHAVAIFSTVTEVPAVS
jgi:hypothetical protein